MARIQLSPQIFVDWSRIDRLFFNLAALSPRLEPAGPPPVYWSPWYAWRYLEAWRPLAAVSKLYNDYSRASVLNCLTSTPMKTGTFFRTALLWSIDQDMIIWISLANTWLKAIERSPSFLSFMLIWAGNSRQGPWLAVSTFQHLKRESCWVSFACPFLVALGCGSQCAAKHGL